MLFRSAEAELCVAVPDASGWPRPPERRPDLRGNLLLVEIPPDFLALKAADFTLARDWRFYGREVFEIAFAKGYLVTDFVFDRSAERPRSVYVLTYGESTLEEG